MIAPQRNQTAAPVPPVPVPEIVGRTPRRMSCFGVLLALIGLLALLNLAVVGVKVLAKPGISPSGQLLYATQFTNSADPDWTQYTSALSYQITGGALVVTADTPKQGAYSDLNYGFSDFDVRVVAGVTIGDDPYSEYGILFRWQNPNNYYMFRVRGDGAYHVARVINGKQDDMSAPHPTPLLALGTNHVNDLRVVGKGDQFQFYINGQLLTLCPKGNDKFSTWSGEQCLSNHQQTAQSISDLTFATGAIGLGVYENNSKVQVAFTNVVIYSP